MVIPFLLISEGKNPKEGLFVAEGRGHGASQMGGGKSEEEGCELIYTAKRKKTLSQKLRCICVILPHLHFLPKLPIKLPSPRSGVLEFYGVKWEWHL